MFAAAELEYTLLAVVLLVFYAVRDSELLRAGLDGDGGRRIAVYAATIGAAVALIREHTVASNIDSFIRQARQPALVKTLLCFQLAIWFYYSWVRKTGNSKALWTVAALPSPVLVLCISGLTTGIRGTGWWSLISSAAAVGAWVCLIRFLIHLSSRAAGREVAWGLNFASLSNLFIVLLLPIENLVADLRDLLRYVIVHD